MLQDIDSPNNRQVTEKCELLEIAKIAPLFSKKSLDVSFNLTRMPDSLISLPPSDSVALAQLDHTRNRAQYPHYPFLARQRLQNLPFQR